MSTSSKAFKSHPTELVVLEKGVAFDDSEEDAVRVQTIVVCEMNEDFFIAYLNCPLSNVPRVLTKTEELKGLIVEAREVFPPWEDGFFTIARNCASSECFIKRQRLLCFHRGDDSQRRLLIQEARVMEELKRNQHPNIMIYYGCVTRRNLMIGLCLEKYCETLKQRVMRESGALDIDKCVQGIRSGLEHLHSLGYCHNDINPMNIMFRSHQDDTPIIVDFDSCIRTGDSLGIKGGSPDFSDERVTHSLPENDFYGLQLTEEFMRKNCDENSEL